MQPNNPRVVESDKYYLQLAMLLAKLWDNSHKFLALPEATRQAVVLAVVGYYQDVIADAGIWRSFVEAHKHLYGTPLPFYDCDGDDYIEYELNLQDVQFVIWYTIDGHTHNNCEFLPLDSNIEWLARLFYKVLDKEYETAPTPTEYNMVMGVDIDDVEDANAIYDLSRWLFFDCYFMKPAAKLALAQQRIETRELKKKAAKNLEDQLHDLADRTMLNHPTGPLAFTIGQWIELIVGGTMPANEPLPSKEPHKLYSQLIKATGGSEIAFYGSYDEMENFLCNKMGWPKQDGGNLPQMMKFNNFVILGNRNRGMLIAHDVAQFIAHPGNPCYDAAQATAQAHEMVIRQGCCPVDLIKYAFGHGLVPDAKLPGDTTGRLLHDNWDFLARLYQQYYYND